MGVDYFAGHQGRTNLQPLDGLPAFVDDFYVYGPLRENEIVRVRGRKPACTTGKEGSGKRVVSQISLFVRQVWGCEDGFKNVSIAHTVYANSRKSRIIETVEKIEKETGYRARRRWNELYPNENPAAYFVAKVDVSELAMEKLQKGLPAMRRLLMSVGCGLYQIDYTQDFSGTLVRPALVQHLVRVHDFFQQGQFAFPENGGCNLDNTDSVGDHVCTFVQTRNGRTASTKFFNKVVCQFEAVDVRESFGGGGGGALGALYRQHRQASTPDYASSRCAKKGMHTARDFAVRLRYGGSFPNCGGRADCGGFGEHRRGPVCCTAASKAMGKPRAASGPMHAAGRPPTGGVISRMERPQQNRRSAGDARQTYSGKGRRRRLLGESNAMDHGGFWLQKLPHISREDCGRGRRRGAIFASSLLHKSRANHSCSEKKAVRGS